MLDPPSLPIHLMEMEDDPNVGWLPLSFRMEPEVQQKKRSRLYKAHWGDHRRYLLGKYQTAKFGKKECMCWL